MIERTSFVVADARMRSAISVAGMSALVIAMALMLSACAADGTGDDGSKSDVKYSSGGSNAYGGVYGSRRLYGFRPH